jgi:predicted alternative tryptophan synthase beta-subunit
MQAVFSKNDKGERDLVGSVLKGQLLYQDMIGLEHMDTYKILTIDMKVS